MQNWTGCEKLNMEETITMKDIRDGNLYTVAKLKDGKCWMTQNLGIVGMNIDSTNSDVDTNFSIPQSKTGGFTNNNSNSVNNTYLCPTKELGAHYTWYTATAGSGMNLTNTTGDG